MATELVDVAFTNPEAVKAGSIVAGLFMGLVPINPILWPIQVAIFIVALLIFLYAIGTTGWHAFLFAYITQALCTALAIWAGAEVLMSGMIPLHKL